ncbi:MAG: cytochrome c [Acidobacteriaceae bacterium]
MKVRFSMIAAASSLALFLTAPIFAQTSGAVTYKAKCQMCHKADGSGNPGMKVPAFSPSASEASLIAVTKNGKGRMPAYAGKLTDPQIKDVVTYIKTLKK